MKIVKSVLARIFALWALIVFVVSMLITVLAVLIIRAFQEPKRSKILHYIFRAWMKIFFVLVGVKRIFKGEENFKRGENYIVVCNHNSFVDVLLASPGIPGPNKTIAKVELSRIPLFGVIYKTGSVLVDRRNDASRKKSYVKMKTVLQRGLHMCIYPEGTRNKTSQPLQRFHDGAFKLSVETRKAILPAVIFYTNKVLPPKEFFYFWPHKVEMHFLPQVPPNDLTPAELKEKVFYIMKTYFTNNKE
ncbi:MAG: 1-acyl-sn-glycerol-3-phosphate acyltransferase [Chitinophagaceae bacterium]|nr:1-acyl-sn-glycerol-3-phosphate acyltransferase [Chitinophagaceae bacterium]